jgi:hypothetical protein
MAVVLGGNHVLSGTAGAGVRVAMTTTSSTVTPGMEFDVYLQISEAGSSINAFDAIIGYDPAALTLIPLSPRSQQVGSLMAGACGSNFHRFRQGADRDTITLVLLCNNVSVSGPGQIYRLRFRASTTPAVTTISFLPGLNFFNEGTSVQPVLSSNLTIGVGVSGVPGEPAIPAGRFSLSAMPNPSRSTTTFLVESRVAGPQELTVSDVLGRVVRRLDSGWFAAGRRELLWNGFNDSGDPVAPGVYYARLSGQGAVVKLSVVRLR